ncbi:MAG: rRNA pseudouridine synthase, partial [Actinomycetales bacterium]
VELTIHEGRNRIVRRMFDAVGHPVQQLARTAFGPLRLGNLRSGSMRDLSAKELGSLYQAVGL